MYSNDQKEELINNLKEMETFKTDTGNEGTLLQKDLIEFFENNNGDMEDLKLRIELYLYAFKIFTRKEVKINRNDFTVYLHGYDLDYDLIKLVKDDFNKFKIVIFTEIENNDSFINLKFIYGY